MFLAAVILIAPVSRYDISKFEVGSTINVLCPVEASCVTNITVSLRRNTTVLEEVFIFNATQKALFNLIVSNDLHGEYNCHATYDINEQMRTASSGPFFIKGL